MGAMGLPAVGLPTMELPYGTVTELSTLWDFHGTAVKMRQKRESEATEALCCSARQKSFFMAGCVQIAMFNWSVCRRLDH